MFKARYIYKRDGTFRDLSVHVPDASDPPEVAAMYARFPPARYLADQITSDEITFDAHPSDIGLQSAFYALEVERDSQRLAAAVPRGS